MTQLYAFIGPAGSGKTYSLNAKLNELCKEREFQEYQTVLAVTFMHGSRKRLSAKLGRHVGDGVSVQCETIDSFCLRLINRFRIRLQRRKPVVINNDHHDWFESGSTWEASFKTIRSTAVSLLKVEDIKKSVAATYPIVLIDEFQDCEDELLTIAQQLSTCCSVLVGADDFQYLRSSDDAPAVKWLRSVDCDLTELSGNQRTGDQLLLSSALALRENSTATSGIEVVARADKHGGLIAYEIARRIVWGKLPTGTSKALITPAGPDSSPWVKGVMKSLGNSLAKGKLSPVPFRWEDNSKDKLSSACAETQDFLESDGCCPKHALQQLADYKDPILRLAGNRCLRLLSLRGHESISAEEFQHIIELAAHSIGAFGTESGSARLAMTVHGAKNREFDYAFILWPYQVPSDPMKKRKLLYNAITRAKLGAFLFVQGDEKQVRDDEVLKLLECGIVADTRKKPSQNSRATR
ncbi:MAG: hypothetical protein Aurels2KO_56590 [Aureliella sp.]